jgi:integrase
MVLIQNALFFIDNTNDKILVCVLQSRVMQRGSIRRYHGSWRLFYYDLQFRDGKRVRVQVNKKLARVCEQYPTKASVRSLADEILAPLNRKQLQAESSLLVCDYIKDFYFPSVEHDLGAGTITSYKFLFSKLEGKLDIELRNFRTVHAQRILREIPVGRPTLIHLKAFMSAVFKHAKQQGILDGQNPVTDSSVPGRPTKTKKAVYTVDDVMRMLDDLEAKEWMTEKQIRQHQTARDVIGVLSFSGLRQSEGRGLRWSDWDEEKQVLNVHRSVFRTIVGPTKNLASENAVPVIPLLRNILQARRARLNAKPEDYIFAGERRGTPLNFHNLEMKVIRPALERSKMKKLVDGKWVIDHTTGITFRGYHGFRRGLGSNLRALGTDPSLIAAILRHSDITTTLELYTAAQDNETRGAMEKLEAKFNTASLTLNQSGT